MRSWLVALSLLPCLVLAGPLDKKLTAEQAMASGEKELSEAEGLRNIGSTRAALEKFGSALSYFTAAHDLAPEATGPLFGMGISLAALGRCKEALPKLTEYLEKKLEGANLSAVRAKEECQTTVSKTSVVSFRTKPSAAEVMLCQGDETILLGISPTTNKFVTPGEYEVIFVQPGKDPITRPLTLEDGDDKQLTINLNRKTLTRLSWDPGLLGMPRSFWWVSAGVIAGAGLTIGAVTLFNLP
jgi:tetratricopeptide (TPR) repeat protein